MPAQDDLSQRKWWLKDPAVLDESDKSFLCETCRHINFRFMLFEKPMLDVRGDYEIPLGSYSDVLERQSCAFCRLVKAALDSSRNSEDEAVPTEHEGKPVMLSMDGTPLGTTLNASHPRLLSVFLTPDPQRKKGTPATKSGPTRQIQLLYQEGEGGEASARGSARGRPVDHEQLDYLLAMYWVRSCRLGWGVHKKEADSDELESRRKLPPNFRLIDAQGMRIVEADPSMQYVTLSYVWPKAPQLKLEMGNRDDLMGPGRPLAKPQFRDRIPQTIRDAMEICRRINDRYLWVDALCIIQDDDRIDGDKSAQIRAMDIIYGASVLTIAATCGNGAEASLPGVSAGPRKLIQRMEIVQGLRLANRPWDFDKSVSESKWNTRAWTFQERVLSKRTLFITPQMMFFRCDHSPSLAQEDLNVEPEVRRRVTWPMDDTGEDRIPIHGSINTETYRRTVENFTSRDITKKCDILNAFRGIEARMEPIFRSGFLYGLPQSELDYGLMWEPVGEIKRRVCRDVDCKNLGCPSPNSLDPIFPSWSWAGWEGAVTYPLRDRLSRVRWVESRPGVAGQASTEQTFTSAEYRGPSPQDGNGGTSTSTTESEWWEEWQQDKTKRGIRFFHHPSDPDAWFLNPTAPGPRRGPNCDPDTPQHLWLEAQTLQVNMSRDWNPQSTAVLHAGTREDTMPPVWQLSLQNDDRKLMGYFRVPTHLANELSHEKKYSAVRIARVRAHYLTPQQIRERKKDGKEDPRPLPAEPAASTTTDHGFERDSDEDDDVLTEAASYPDEVSTEDAAHPLPFDRQRYDAYKPFCMYEFLFVERVGNVAFRLGTGMMHVDAWAQEKLETEILTLA
ncbi:heterokaryon incompatibility protein-domain-containing protein [Chaetomium strumarium]|uniref:Heterokaryon incompatibility protein-domain-containing protein n=1 Tax=Chaetomium strumarium TaxID=1170767 RepID=A0AAJ0GQE1_9PEZI|nr:heterokaryon incompatibility protein-domain-containing protein [Chaetomium strumarium]